MKTTWIVLCQEVVRDGRTGEEVAGDLFGIRSDCELIEYKSLDDAAAALAATTMDVRLEVPNEAGWHRWREMPRLMQVKFLRLVEAKKKAASTLTVPVGIMLSKMRPSQELEPGWSMLFIASLPDGKHAAPDLESMADMLASDEVTVCRLAESRADGEYDLPDAWHDLLIRLIDARRMAASAIERARQ